MIDATNPLKWESGPVWNPPAEGSMTAALQNAHPAVKFVKTFNTFGFEHMADPKMADLFMAGDDAEAKRIISEMATTAGFRPVDVGPTRNAGALENMAIIWIHLATVGQHPRNFTFQLSTH